MKRFQVFTVFLTTLCIATARADIYQWEYIDPLQPELGKKQSSTLAPDGAGRNAVPSAQLSGLDLTMAWLRNYDLLNADFSNAILSNGDLADADLTAASFFAATLTDAKLSGADIRGANFFIVPGGPIGSPDLGTGLTIAQLYSTASYQSGELKAIGLGNHDLTGCNFAGMNLTDADLGFARVAGADFSNAEVRGASFSYTGITSAQLYSTASYQSDDLTGIGLGGKDLSEWSFAGKDLTDAYFGWATLSNTDLSNADVRGASFYRTSELTSAQLYSTGSYQSSDLTGINLGFNDLMGWSFAGTNLIDADFWDATLNEADFRGANLTNAYFRDATLSGAYLNGADARAADQMEVSSAATHNLIHPDGHVEGLDVTAGETMRLWDFDPSLMARSSAEPIGGIPILVEDGLSIDPAGRLRAVFEDDQWGSTINFEPGIPVSLDGTLELLIEPNKETALPSLVGTTYQIFDWTGVSPEGQFDLILTQNGLLWNTGNLYTTGEVTLIGAVPEPTTLYLTLIGLAGVVSCIRRARR